LADIQDAWWLLAGGLRAVGIELLVFPDLELACSCEAPLIAMQAAFTLSGLSGGRVFGVSNYRKCI
jgi:hypothetical protein